MIIRLEPSHRKKWIAVFSDGDRVHFGGKNYMDFTLYWAQYGPKHARAKRMAYIKRHSVNETWKDPKKPGTLSRYILWESPRLETALKKYNERFYSSSIKRFPSIISSSPSPLTKAKSVNFS